MQTRSAILILCLATILVYLSSFWNAFVWDDEQFIYHNTYVRQLLVPEIFRTSTTAGAGVNSNYYRPLTTVSFGIDCALWGLQPFGFHLTNTLAHLIAGLLLFLCLRKLALSQHTALCIGLLFLLHPIQTEAVTYVNSRGDSLFVLFGLLALLSFIWLIQRPSKVFKVHDIEFTLPDWLVSLFVASSYVLSILSKEIGIVFVGLMTITWVMVRLQQKALQRKKLSLMKLWQENRMALATLLMCGLIALGYLYLRATSLNFANSFDFYQDRSLYSQNVGVRLLTFTKVVFIYLRLLALPYPLHMERSTSLVASLVSIWPWLWLATMTISLLFAIKQLRANRPIALYGWLWFYVALLPVCGIIPINGMLYEHWLYLPMVGFYMFLYAVISALLALVVRPLAKQKIPAFGALILIFAILTIRQNYYWSSPIRFYTYLLRHTASGRIYNNLAMAYADDNQPQRALEAYDKALALGDVYPQIHHNRGNLYVQLNNLPAAIKSYERAIALNPQFGYSYQPLIRLYAQTGELEKAEQLLQQARQQLGRDQSWTELEQLLATQKRQASTGTSAPTAPTATPAAGGAAR